MTTELKTLTGTEKGEEDDYRAEDTNRSSKGRGRLLQGWSH